MSLKKALTLDTGTTEGRIEALSLIVVGIEGRIRSIDQRLERLEAAIENLDGYLERQAEEAMRDVLRTNSRLLSDLLR